MMPASVSLSRGRGFHRMADLLNVVYGIGGAAILGGSKWLFDRFKKDGLEEGYVKLTEERNVGIRDSLNRLRDELKDQADERKTDVAELRNELRATASDFRGVAADIAALQTNQTFTNSITAKAIEGLGIKQDRHAEQLADHASTIRLLTDNVTMMRQRVDQIDGPTVRQVEREKEG